MPESNLQTAILAIERALAASGVRHMLIGGVAVIAHGVRRLTDDVDATLWAPGIDVQELLASLAGHRIEPRIEDALAFAEQSQVLLLRHEPSGIDIDLSLAWLPFEDEAIERSIRAPLDQTVIRVATPEDLIIYKAIAARQRDKSDIERLLELYEEEIDVGRVKRIVGELATALERPDLLEDLTALIHKTLRHS